MRRMKEGERGLRRREKREKITKEKDLGFPYMWTSGACEASRTLHPLPAPANISTLSCASIQLRISVVSLTKVEVFFKYFFLFVFASGLRDIRASCSFLLSFLFTDQHVKVLASAWKLLLLSLNSSQNLFKAQFKLHLTLFQVEKGSYYSKRRL